MQSQPEQVLSDGALQLAPAPSNDVAAPVHHTHAPASLPTLPLSGKHTKALVAARAFCEALYANEDGPPPRDRMDWLMGELDDLLTRAGWRSAGFYKFGLTLVSYLAPLFIFKLRPLWKLPLEERLRALRKMEATPAAALVLGCKTMVCIMYYEHPDVLREAGYLPGCHQCAATVRAAPLTRRGAR